MALHGLSTAILLSIICLMSVQCEKRFLHVKQKGVEIADVREERNAQGSLR
jgi:hypothetical protein